MKGFTKTAAAAAVAAEAGRWVTESFECLSIIFALILLLCYPLIRWSLVICCSVDLEVVLKEIQWRDSPISKHNWYIHYPTLGGTETGHSKPQGQFVCGVEFSLLFLFTFHFFSVALCFIFNPFGVIGSEPGDHFLVGVWVNLFWRFLELHHTKKCLLCTSSQQHSTKGRLMSYDECVTNWWLCFIIFLALCSRFSALSVLWSYCI